MEKKIKIIDIQKKIIDLATVDLDDLQTALDIILSEDTTLNAQSIYGFKDLSEKLKYNTLIRNDLENIISIDIRTVFKDMAIIPIIDSFGLYAFSDINENLYKTKIPNNSMAIILNNNINSMAIKDNKNNKSNKNIKSNKNNTDNTDNADNDNAYTSLDKGLYPIQISKDEMVSISHILISEKYELFSLIKDSFKDFFDNYLGLSTYLNNGSFHLPFINLISNIYPKFNLNSNAHIDKTYFNTEYNKSVFKYYIGNNTIIPIDRYKYVYKKSNDIIHFVINSYIRYSIPFFACKHISNGILNSSIVSKPIIYKTWLTESSREALIIFLKKLLNINNLKINDKNFIFDGTPIYEIYNQGALNILYYVLTNNDIPLIDKFYSNLISTNSKKVQKFIIEKKYLENQNKIKIYLLLIEAKLGIIKLNQIINNKESLSDINLIISKLEPHEKDIINNAYNNQMILLKAIGENKCPHIKIYNRLRRSNNANQTISLLKELLTYSSKGNDNKSNWVICKKCNYPLICPHVIDKLQAEVNMKSYDEIILLLNKYFNTVTTKEKNENLYNYYCSICSEKIAETSEEFNYKNSKMGDINNFIKIKLWSVITNSMEYITFTSPINPNYFVNTATEILYDIINKLNSTKKINLSELSYKSDESEEIDPLIYFYCILFTYAYILNKILVNKNIELKETFNKKSSAGYAEAIIKIILKKYALLIAQLSLKLEFINKKFVEAYKIVKELNSTEDEIYTPIEMEQIPICDAPYRYAKNIIKMISSKEISERDMFIKILGKPPEYFIEKVKAIKKIQFAKDFEFIIKMKNNNLYSELYIPLPITHFIKDLNAKGANVAIKDKGTKTAINAKGAKAAIKDKGAKATLKSNSKYGESIFYEAYNIFHQYIAKIYSQKEYNEYIIKLNKFKQIENKFIARKQFNYAFSVFYFNIKKTRQYIKKNVSMSSIYDENGNYHKWDIYCYEDEDLTLSQLKEKKNWTDRILDCKCSICGIRQKDLHKLNGQKILKAITLKSEIDVFFIFYQSRCPEGNLHEWDDKKCKKCNLYINYIIIKTSDAVEYYNKYYNIYKAAIGILAIDNNAIATTATTTTASTPTTNTTTPPATTTTATTTNTTLANIDYSWVVKLSKFAKIDVKVIESIGCMNFRKYDNIKEGLDIDLQVPFTSIEDERIYSANAEIRYIFTMYSLLLNIEKNKNDELIALLDKINFPKFEYKNIANFLPSIASSKYNLEFNYMKTKLAAKDLFLFTINHLSFYIIMIANNASDANNASGKTGANGANGANGSSGANGKYTELLCKAFSTFLITSILRNQKLLSTPVTFSWKYFKESDNDNIYDLDQVGDVGEDEEPVADENMEFSEQNIDYDMDSDAEADNYKESDN